MHNFGHKKQIKLVRRLDQAHNGGSAQSGLYKMATNGRRLPWDAVEQVLIAFEVAQPKKD